VKEKAVSPSAEQEKGSSASYVNAAFLETSEEEEEPTLSTPRQLLTKSSSTRLTSTMEEKVSQPSADETLTASEEEQPGDNSGGSISTPTSSSSSSRSTLGSQTKQLWMKRKSPDALTSWAIKKINLKDLKGLAEKEITYQGYISVVHGIGGRGAFKLQIDGETYVVKCWPLEIDKSTGLPLDDPAMADHVMNTDLINGLGLDDVHAPASQAMNSEVKNVLKLKLIKQNFNENEKRDLFEAMNGNAMISPMAPALTIDTLFYDKNVAQVKQTFLDHVKTYAGAYALGELIAVDLIDGMYDRLVEVFNGGNFSFNPNTKQLWCIDNAKRHQCSMSATDDKAWTDWVIQCTAQQDDTHDSATDKGISLPELFHWMIYERAKSNSGFVTQMTLNAQEKNVTLAAIKQAFTDIFSKSQVRVSQHTPGFLTGGLRPRLGQRLDFLDARNKFTDLLSFTKFETIPTPTAKKPNSDDPLFTTGFAFVVALNDNTQGLVNLTNNAVKVWGKLDPAVADRINTLGLKWVNALQAAGDNDGAQRVAYATKRFLEQLHFFM
jgi:hypothetical protein